MEAFLYTMLAHLSELHKRKIIHRDLKPDNIKYLPGGRCVLLDFGISKGSTETQKEAKAFTPNFSPPEQIKGTQTVPSSDLYSLGATAYYLLTGIPPTDSGERLLGKKLASPRNVKRGTIPLGLERTLLQMMELDVQRRPASAQVALDYLKHHTKSLHWVLANALVTLIEKVAVRYGSRLKASPMSRWMRKIPILGLLPRTFWQSHYVHLVSMLILGFLLALIGGGILQMRADDTSPSPTATAVPSSTVPVASPALPSAYTPPPADTSVSTSGTIHVVVQNGLNLRTLPIISGDTFIRELRAGEEVEQLGESTVDDQGTTWIRVRALADRREGWVSGKYLR